MIRSRRALAATAASALALVGTVLAQPVSAGHISCGDTITESTVLDSDLVACDQGLLISGSNITLDLNGHTVSGLRQFGEGPGITIEDGTGVVVRGPGRVAQFDAGIYIVGGSGNTVQNVTVEENYRTTQVNFGDGILLDDSDNNRILNNTVRRNGPYNGIGLISGASSNTISGNIIDGNNIGFTNAAGTVIQQQDYGVRIEGPGSNSNTVSNNQVRGSGLEGIGVLRANPANNDNIIINNVVQGNGFHTLAQRRGNGIALFGGAPSAVNPTRTIVSGNFVFGNAANGIRVEAQGNQILNNRTGNNGGAALGPAFDLFDTNVDCDANVWRGNTYQTANPECTTAP